MVCAHQLDDKISIGTYPKVLVCVSTVTLAFNS